MRAVAVKAKRIRADFWELANEFYDYEIPGYVVKPGRTFITIQTGSDLFGYSPLKITIKDVVRYYATQAGNTTSGIRTLAGFPSDWRGIDALAEEALGWFKHVNKDGLRRALRNMGIVDIEPQF